MVMAALSATARTLAPSSASASSMRASWPRAWAMDRMSPRAPAQRVARSIARVTDTSDGSPIARAAVAHEAVQVRISPSSRSSFTCASHSSSRRGGNLDVSRRNSSWSRSWASMASATAWTRATGSRPEAAVPRRPSATSSSPITGARRADAASASRRASAASVVRSTTCARRTANASMLEGSG